MFRPFPLVLALLLTVAPAAIAADEAGVTVTGQLQQWHCITLSVAGPQASEAGQPNPFRDYRLDVEFRHAGQRLSRRVPGYFAADGAAAESGAEAGCCWRVHFVPDVPGRWTYQVSFRHGSDVAISADAAAGQPAAGDGLRGELTIAARDETAADPRAKGMLCYVGQRYLQFAGTQEWFIKGGADSPENFLAYADFDGTRTGPRGQQRAGEARADRLHHYEPHVRDWRPGDPQWRNGRGKGIVGALNYLADKGVNSVYFLTMNVGGDGNDVWPWTDAAVRDRFDCSKLDQWEIVFSHMDRRGIALHVVTQETENDRLLDGGDLGPLRKLYYRELIARFGHHSAVVWNLGEENVNSDAQRKQFAAFIHGLDPYRHPIVVHTHPGKYEAIYGPLLGFPHLHGPSLQMGNMRKTHEETLRWVGRSAESGRPWVVCLDEIGPANTGVRPDADDPDHDDVRRHALWGNLMAGGAGCEWYFGYKFPHNDLNCEDFRSRERMWDQTRSALDFFRQHLPFAEMTPHDELVGAKDGWCLARPGAVYAVYLPKVESPELQVAAGDYEIKWFDPRRGGPLRDGTAAVLSGPGKRALGEPPADLSQDWVALVRRVKAEAPQGPERWEAAIARFEARDRENPPPKQGILFLGSSSVVMWDTAKSFPDLPAINRGFGGSQVADSLHFAERIALPYEPQMIVFYAGDNDLAAKKTPQQIAADFEALVKKVHANLPKTKIIFIAVKPSIARWKLIDQQRETNRLVREFTAKDPRLTFLDVEKPMLGPDGQPRKELFKSDGLHLNAEGYKLWNELLRPLLDKAG
jgi:lysophospholipase L1-like esterase